MTEQPEGQEPEEQPEGGATPPPASEPEAPEGQKTDEAPKGGTEDLKAEAQRLRADLREETAKRLVTQHSLPSSTADLLKLVPRNEMEAKAQALAEELKTTPAEPEAPAEPPNADAVAAMGGGEGTPTVSKPAGGQDDLLKQIEGVGSIQELEELQTKLRMQQRE